jgi:lipopolysaccharide/colanic/teichoic acid biosynthesis glycosyltransferase
LHRVSLASGSQLFNVLRRDMSIIGPRPYFADEVLARPEAAEILSVRRGITGVWQVNGRSDRTFGERIAFHLDYGRGPSLDVRIIASTTSLPSAVEGRTSVSRRNRLDA